MSDQNCWVAVATGSNGQKSCICRQVHDWQMTKHSHANLQYTQHSTKKNKGIALVKQPVYVNTIKFSAMD